MSRLVHASAFSDRYGLTHYEDGAWVDRGHYISVFAQDLLFDGVLEANGCAMYAGLLGSTAPNESITNKPIPAGIEAKFEIGASEIRDISYIGAVAVRRSVKHGLVITNGVTTALESSPLRLAQNVRMVQMTMDVVNRTLDDMVGEPYVPTLTLKEIDRRVKEALSFCTGLQYLKSYDYSVNFDSYTNGVRIEMILTGRNTVESVKTRAALLFTKGGDTYA